MQQMLLNNDQGKLGPFAVPETNRMSDGAKLLQIMDFFPEL